MNPGRPPRVFAVCEDVLENLRICCEYILTLKINNVNEASCSKCYFPVNNLLSIDVCLNIFVSSTLATNAAPTRKKYEKVTFFTVMTMPNLV